MCRAAKEMLWTKSFFEENDAEAFPPSSEITQVDNEAAISCAENLEISEN